MSDRRLSLPPRAAPVTPAGSLPFAPGPAMLQLLAAGLIWIPIAFYDRRGLLFLLAWNVGVCAAAIRDFRQLPRPGQLTIGRRWEGPLTIGVASTVTVTLRTAGTPLRLRLTDFVPASLRDEVAILDLRPSDASVVESSYQITPRERGDVPIGIVTIRWQSPLRMAERRGVADLTQTV